MEKSTRVSSGAAASAALCVFHLSSPKQGRGGQRGQRGAEEGRGAAQGAAVVEESHSEGKKKKKSVDPAVDPASNTNQHTWGGGGQTDAT